MSRYLTFVVFLCVVYCVAGKLELQTKENAGYKLFPYSQKTIHFKVKIGRDAHIALATKSQESDPMIEIAIGGWSNTNSVIARKYKTVPIKVAVDTPGILSDAEFRGFWVSWDGGVIAVGREGEDAPFISWKDPEPFTVRYVGVHSLNIKGSWIIEDTPPAVDSQLCSSGPQSKLACQELHTEKNAGYKLFPYSQKSIHFKVKIGRDAHIALATKSQESDPMIEIAIGGWSNTNSVIARKYKTVPIKVAVETPGILSAAEFRGFWVSWDGGVIAVGREGEDAPFISWKDPEPFTVRYVGVHSLETKGSWIIEDTSPAPERAPPPSIAPSNIADNQLCSSGPQSKLACQELHTKENAGYKLFPYSQKSIHFKVKIERDAHIALATKSQESDPMIEIAIGGWSNTNSVIARKYKTVPIKVAVDTPGILSDAEFRGFWVSWDGGVIAVGREGEDAPFISWKDPEPFTVRYVGVHSLNIKGSWIIQDTPPAPERIPPPSIASNDIADNQLCSSGPQSKLACQDINTSADDVNYKFYPFSSRFVNFKVKAVNDAHIGLSTGPALSGPMIEVVIGGWGNTKSVIRRIYHTVPDKFTVSDKITAETTAILSVAEFRGFWISVDDGVIKVGREGADEPFISWPDPDPFPISFLGVHTGYGSTGSWKIEDPPANPVAVRPPSTSVETDSVCCKCCYRRPLINPKDVSTADTAEYTFFPYSNTSASVNFRVKAANDAHLGLSTKPKLSGPMYEILLGGWSNSKSILRRLYPTEPDKFTVSDKVTVETPGILNNEEPRGFWFHWYGGVLTLGHEGTDAPFMSWTDPEPFRVTHIGVHTGYGSTGSWKISDPSSAPTAASSSTAEDVVDSRCCKCCNRKPPPSGSTTSAPAFTNAYTN